jgi:Ca2+-binding EF-hand superfamily protein
MIAWAIVVKRVVVRKQTERDLRLKINSKSKTQLRTRGEANRKLFPESSRWSSRFPAMKTHRIFAPLLALALLPGLALAAKADKPQKKRAKEPTVASAPGLSAYDKNGNKQIDADELAAVQKTFSELRQLDKNGNGEIEQSEVERPKPAATTDRKDRAMAGLKKVDKNSNGKIDTDEVEGLQKALAGSRILERLDQNSNGKLESGELERLNKRFAQGGFDRKRKDQSLGSKPTPPPAAKPDSIKPAEPKKEDLKKDEPKKDEPKKDEPKDPFLPNAKPTGE